MGLACTTTAMADSTAEPGPKTDIVDPYQRPSRLTGLPKKILLYQYDVCPFCCKVKAILDFHKIPYEVIEVNPLTKGELKWSTYKKVPVVKLDEETITDSSAIMSRIAAEIQAAKPQQQPLPPTQQPSSWWGSRPVVKPEVKSEPSGAPFTEEETEWRKWVDQVLVKTLTANIYRSWEETRQTFDYMVDKTQWAWHTRTLAQYAGSVLMWQVGSRMPKKYHIEGDLREALYKELDKFIAAVGSKPFLGGDSPNLADLSLYGVLRAVEGTNAWKDCMQHSQVQPWYQRMESAVGPSARVAVQA